MTSLLGTGKLHTFFYSESASMTSITRLYIGLVFWEKATSKRKNTDFSENASNFIINQSQINPRCQSKILVAIATLLVFLFHIQY
jgi:hypothetical protein